MIIEPGIDKYQLVVRLIRIILVVIVTAFVAVVMIARFAGDRIAFH